MAFQLPTKQLSLDRRNVRQDVEPLVAAPLAIESATLASYNAGSSAVDHFLGIPPYTENRRATDTDGIVRNDGDDADNVDRSATNSFQDCIVGAHFIVDVAAMGQSETMLRSAKKRVA